MTPFPPSSPRPSTVTGVGRVLTASWFRGWSPSRFSAALRPPAWSCPCYFPPLFLEADSCVPGSPLTPLLSLCSSVFLSPPLPPSYLLSFEAISEVTSFPPGPCTRLRGLSASLLIFLSFCILRVVVTVKGGASRGRSRDSWVEAGRFGPVPSDSHCRLAAPPHLLPPRPWLWALSNWKSTVCLESPGPFLNRISYKHTKAIHNGNKNSTAAHPLT